jgi:UDP-glucose 4-epimerase
VKKILITGAGGFIGRHAAELFSKEGWHVTGMDESPCETGEWQKWGVAVWHSSAVSLDALITYAGKPDVILHCAGSGEVGYSMSHPYEDYKRNVETIVSVLEFARCHVPGARILYPSSAAVYGVAERMPIREQDELKPITPYGVHKKVAEDLCRSYAEHFGLFVAVIRFFSVYGQGLRKQLLWDACSKISKNDYSFWGSGAEVRDLVHIDDAVKLLMMAAGHASPQCPVVNGASGVGIEIREVLSEIFRCLGKTESPVFSGFCRPGDPLRYVADISRAVSYRWKPEWDWRRGIREYVEWFRANAQ